MSRRSHRLHPRPLVAAPVAPPVAALVAALGLAVCALAVAPDPAAAGAPEPGALQQAFAAAAREFHIPESVLLAVSYNESRWESHAGPSTGGGYGVMHLVDLGRGLPAGPAPLPAAAALLVKADQRLKVLRI